MSAPRRSPPNQPPRTPRLAGRLLTVLVSGLLVGTAPALASSTPAIESESVSHITSTDATLEAQINPNGRYTGYEFQIDTNASYNLEGPVCPFELPGSAQCEAIRAGEPLPAGLVEPEPQYIPAGSGVQSVSLDLASIGAVLQPGTTYHYRVIASSGGAPTVQGPDQTFTTPPAGPFIVSESASHIAEHDATLEAQINPNGLESAYEFQIDTNGSYNYTKPVCPLGECEAISVGEPLPAGLVEPQPQYIPAGSGDQTVSLDLASIGAVLQPGTIYHYHVIAANNGGPTVDGPDQTFTTEPISARPLGVATPSGTNGGNQPGTSSMPAGSGGSSSTAGGTPLVALLQKAVEPKPLTKAQKLSKVLKQCEKEPKRKRASCEKEYGKGEKARK